MEVPSLSRWSSVVCLFFFVFSLSLSLCLSLCLGRVYRRTSQDVSKQLIFVFDGLPFSLWPAGGYNER